MEETEKTNTKIQYKHLKKNQQIKLICKENIEKTERTLGLNH